MTTHVARKWSVWAVAGLSGAVFLASGSAKLIDHATWYARFEHWGYAGWLSPIVGTLEVIGAIAVIVPRTAPLAGVALGIEMVGAVFTHLRAADGPVSAVPLVMLAALWISALPARLPAVRRPENGGAATPFVHSALLVPKFAVIPNRRSRSMSVLRLIPRRRAASD